MRCEKIVIYGNVTNDSNFSRKKKSVEISITLEYSTAVPHQNTLFSDKKNSNFRSFVQSSKSIFTRLYLNILLILSCFTIF